MKEITWNNMTYFWDCVLTYTICYISPQIAQFFISLYWRSRRWSDIMPLKYKSYNVVLKPSIISLLSLSWRMYHHVLCREWNYISNNIIDEKTYLVECKVIWNLVMNNIDLFRNIWWWTLTTFYLLHISNLRYQVKYFYS